MKSNILCKQIEEKLEHYQPELILLEKELIARDGRNKSLLGLHLAREDRNTFLPGLHPSRLESIKKLINNIRDVILNISIDQKKAIFDSLSEIHENITLEEFQILLKNFQVDEDSSRLIEFISQEQWEQFTVNLPFSFPKLKLAILQMIPSMRVIPNERKHHKQSAAHLEKKNSKRKKKITELLDNIIELIEPSGDKNHEIIERIQKESSSMESTLNSTELRKDFTQFVINRMYVIEQEIINKKMDEVFHAKLQNEYALWGKIMHILLQINKINVV